MNILISLNVKTCFTDLEEGNAKTGTPARKRPRRIPAMLSEKDISNEAKAAPAKQVLLHKTLWSCIMITEPATDLKLEISGTQLRWL